MNALSAFFEADAGWSESTPPFDGWCSSRELLGVGAKSGWFAACHGRVLDVWHRGAVGMVGFVVPFALKVAQKLCSRMMLTAVATTGVAAGGVQDEHGNAHAKAVEFRAPNFEARCVRIRPHSNKYSSNLKRDTRQELL